MNVMKHCMNCRNFNVERIRIEREYSETVYSPSLSCALEETADQPEMDTFRAGVPEIGRWISRAEICDWYQEVDG